MKHVAATERKKLWTRSPAKPTAISAPAVSRRQSAAPAGQQKDHDSERSVV